MTQIYKVFKETKPLVLHNIPMYCSERDNYVYVKVESAEDYRTILDSFWDFNGIDGVSLYCERLDSIVGEFRKNFRFIEAAGGIVLNEENKLLVIKRNGFLDLPKGHFKKRETSSQAAIREVTEECGINALSLTGDQPVLTYHMYELKGDKVLKQTQWFKMKFSGNEPLVPQAEEHIEAAMWMSEKEVKEQLNAFYPSLFDLLEGVFQ